jgi:hypothetical protein
MKTYSWLLIPAIVTACMNSFVSSRVDEKTQTMTKKGCSNYLLSAMENCTHFEQNSSTPPNSHWLSWPSRRHSPRTWSSWWLWSASGGRPLRRPKYYLWHIAMCNKNYNRMNNKENLGPFECHRPCVGHNCHLNQQSTFD